MDYYDLGTYSRKVTTSSPTAQLWFDRGLNWIYAFNHEEAIVCFRKALEVDPECAMAHWGIAYAIGPNYNKPWDAFEDDERPDALTLKIRSHRELARHHLNLSVVITSWNKQES